MIKKIMKSLLIVCLVVVLVTGCKSNKNNDEHVDTNPDSSIVSGATIEGLKIGQLSIVYQNKISRLVANVQNTNPNDYTLRVISVKLYNKEDELLIDTTGYIGTTIKANETKQLIIEVTDDLKSAARVEYSIIK
ncbi:MAG: hypothetical protein ACM3O4_03200 [Ignavibacteriales bacterium]